jgi:hypothetical protein
LIACPGDKKDCPMNYCRKCTGEWKGKEMCKNCAKAKLEEAEMEGKYSYKLEES